MSKSKMQELIDRAEEGLSIARRGHVTNVGEIQSIEALIEAVKLLSKAEAQNMGDIERLRHRSNYGEIPIGGGA